MLEKFTKRINEIRRTILAEQADNSADDGLLISEFFSFKTLDEMKKDKEFIKSVKEMKPLEKEDFTESILNKLLKKDCDESSAEMQMYNFVKELK